MNNDVPFSVLISANSHFWTVFRRGIISCSNCDSSTHNCSTLFWKNQLLDTQKLNCSNQLNQFYKQFLFSVSRRMTAPITYAQITNGQITTAQIITTQITTAWNSTAWHVRYTCAAAKTMCGSKDKSMCGSKDKSMCGSKDMNMCSSLD